MLNRKKLLYAGIFLLFSTGIAAAAPAVATTDLNVRAGAGTNYSVLAVISGGSVVDVAGCGDGWCHLPTHGGYVRASYLSAAPAAYGYIPPYEGYTPPMAVPVRAPDGSVYYAPGPSRVTIGIGTGRWDHRPYPP